MGTTVDIKFAWLSKEARCSCFVLLKAWLETVTKSQTSNLKSWQTTTTATDKIEAIATCFNFYLILWTTVLALRTCLWKNLFSLMLIWQVLLTSKKSTEFNLASSNSWSPFKSPSLIFGFLSQYWNFPQILKFSKSLIYSYLLLISFLASKSVIPNKSILCLINYPYGSYSSWRWRLCPVKKLPMFNPATPIQQLL